MESSPETQRKLLQGDVARTKGALSALERDKLFTGMLLEKYNNDLSYSQDFLDGHYKFTFLIQGDTQTGKTTFLNVLLDDAIIPSGHNAIIVVQYDESREIPALFTARLNEIFNSERQIFIIKPETLTDTGRRGSIDIHNTLKQPSKIVNPLSQSDQMVFVIKYRISWLKELMKDEFIVNRIQFVDIEMPSKNNPGPENVLRLGKIISSADHANVFVADGTKLFTIETAAKYNELSAHKEKSLLIMNRIDQLGAIEHIRKIKKNKTIDRLCSKLQIDSLQTIEDKIKDLEETEEMRCEIFLQSFYEDQEVDQDMLTDGDIIYFVSALFAFNKILLHKYENCESVQEKAAFWPIFDERNKNHSVYQNNKREAALMRLDILQYYLQEQPDLYQNNFEPVKKALSKIAKTKFTKLWDELIKKVEEIRLKISDLKPYLTDALSEQQIGELIALRQQIKDIIQERSSTFIELVNSFREKIMWLFQAFLRKIEAIDRDFFIVKAKFGKELTYETQQFEENVYQTIDEFKRDNTNMETSYKKEINALKHTNKDKNYMNYYIEQNVKSEYEDLEKENEGLVNVIEGFASIATDVIVSFINDGKRVSKLRYLLCVLSKFFCNESTCSFQSTVIGSTENFKKEMDSLMRFHCKEENKMKDKFEDHFTNYLNNTRNLERAQKIIIEHFKHQVST